jgi:hypothetical protein
MISTSKKEWNALTDYISLDLDDKTNNSEILLSESDRG